MLKASKESWNKGGTSSLVRWFGVIDKTMHVVNNSLIPQYKLMYTVMLVMTGHYNKSSMATIKQILQSSASKSSDAHLSGERMTMEDGKKEADLLKEQCINGLVLAAGVYCDEPRCRTQQSIALVFGPWRKWFGFQSHQNRSTEQTFELIRGQFDGGMMLPVKELMVLLHDVEALRSMTCRAQQVCATGSQ